MDVQPFVRRPNTLIPLSLPVCDGVPPPLSRTLAVLVWMLVYDPIESFLALAVAPFGF